MTVHSVRSAIVQQLIAHNHTYRGHEEEVCPTHGHTGAQAMITHVTYVVRALGPRFLVQQ